MCDFLSIAVRADGAVAKTAGNSHSGAVKAAGWRENDQMADLRGKYFVEVEWNCEGDYPGADKISRGEINEKQRKVIDGIYDGAAKLLADPAKNAERMLFGAGIFAGDEYADLRWKTLINPKCPKRVATKLVGLLLHANGERIKSFDPRITKIEGNLAIEDGYEISAPALVKVGGYLDVSGSAKLDALTKVGGDLAVYGSAKLDAPALVEVGGYLDVSGSAKLDAPALVKVGGDLAVYGSAKLDALTKVGGDLAVYGSAKLDAPALVKVGGDLAVYGSAKLDAPKLKKANSQT